MTDQAINNLIEASSLGTPNAQALRAATSDETTRRIVQRTEEFAAARGLDPADLVAFPNGDDVIFLYRREVEEFLARSRENADRPGRPDDINRLRARVAGLKAELGRQ